MEKTPNCMPLLENLPKNVPDVHDGTDADVGGAAVAEIGDDGTAAAVGASGGRFNRNKFGFRFTTQEDDQN